MWLTPFDAIGLTSHELTRTVSTTGKPLRSRVLGSCGTMTPGCVVPAILGTPSRATGYTLAPRPPSPVRSVDQRRSSQGSAACDP